MKKILSFLFILVILPSFSFAQVINVATIERPPMAFKSESGQWEGYAIDIFKEIAKDLSLDYKIKEYGVFSDMINSVKQKENDIAVANITITSKREEAMDFSQPIYDSGLQVVINKDRGGKSIFRIVWESGILWFLLGAFGLLLVIAHIIWFFERGTKSDRHDYFRDDYLGGVWDTFWWAFIIMTMGGFENEVPATKFSRFLAIVWITTSLFFVSFLTAQITSSLTVAGLNSDISSYHDLEYKKVGVMKSQSVIDFMKTEVGANPIIFEKYEDFYKALKNKKVDALVGDAPIVNYYVNTKAKNDFILVGPIFKPEKYGLLFQDRSNLRENFDREIIRLQENGRMVEIYQKYFSN